MNRLEENKLKVFTAKAQVDKAINSLKGILLGINLDGNVNEKEINELHKWVIAHNSLIKRNPFNEFMNIIEQTILNKIPLQETIEDLFWLCQKYENDNYYFNGVTADLQLLQGICHGILSDGVINEKEIFNLHNWLKENEHLNSYYPYDEIRSLILTIVSDHKVSEEEIVILKAYFNQFVSIQNDEIQNQINREVLDYKIPGICTSEPNVVFSNKIFCITGVLKRSSRDELIKEIVTLGGLHSDNISKNTDYLIVGDNGNPAWAFSCYGRKVEKALSLRKEGHTIMLIHEYDFADILDELK